MIAKAAAKVSLHYTLLRIANEIDFKANEFIKTRLVSKTRSFQPNQGQHKESPLLGLDEAQEAQTMASIGSSHELQNLRLIDTLNEAHLS